MAIFQRIKEAIKVLRGSYALKEYAEDDDKYYRRLSDQSSFEPIEIEKARKISRYLYFSNPIARRFVDIPRDYSTQEFNMSVKKYIYNKLTGEKELVEDNIPQMIWDDFYYGPINNLYKEKHLFVQNLLINGELCIPVEVNKTNGKVLIGYIDPDYIKEIIPDGKNVRIIRQIVVSKNLENVKYDVINVDSDPKSATYGLLVGNCFYFKINYMLGMLRGYPEILEDADWIDGLDQFIWNNLEGAMYRNAFFIHEVREGATPQDLRNIRVQPLPKSGQRIVTNEKVKFNVISSGLQANDISETMRLYKNLILAGKGYPEHWFASGSETNRATAFAQNEPAFVALKMKQNIIKNMFIEIAKFVIDQAIIAGVIKLKETETMKEYIDIELDLINLNRQEIETVAGSFVQLVNALTIAEERYWITPDDAKRLVDTLIYKLGVNVSTNTVEEVKAEQSEEAVEESIYQQEIKKLINEANRD